MNHLTKYKWQYLTMALAVGISALIQGCSDKSTPAAPDLSFSPVTTITSPPPAPLPEAPTPTVEPEEIPAGPTVEILSRGETWTFRVTSPTRQKFVIASYKDPNRDIATQELFLFDSVDFQGTRELSIQTPPCQYQVDIFVGVNSAPSPPVNMGTKTLIGRLGTNDCPVPPRCDIPKLERDAEHYAEQECRRYGVKKILLDKEACVYDFTCNTCGDIYPPMADELKYSVSNHWLYNMSVKVHNNAAFTYVLNAGNTENPNRYEKRIDKGHPSCGGYDILRLKNYYHRNHSACLWTLRVFQDDTEVQTQVVIDRCHSDNNIPD